MPWPLFKSMSRRFPVFLSLTSHVAQRTGGLLSCSIVISDFFFEPILENLTTTNSFFLFRYLRDHSRIQIRSSAFIRRQVAKQISNHHHLFFPPSESQHNGQTELLTAFARCQAHCDLNCPTPCITRKFILSGYAATNSLLHSSKKKPY